MIYLFTGAPGSGKTLRAIWYLVSLPPDHNWRTIYTNITDLQIPGKKVLPLPDSWQAAPKGSIFVIDEVQKVWPSTGKQGLSTKPDVLALDEHRHGGYDFYLITQHPTLVDSTVRKFVTMHEHLVRASGREMARVFSKNRVFEVGDARELKAAESAFWRYPKEYYDFYKSADIHVVRKFKLPLGLKLLITFLAISTIYVAYHFYSHRGIVGVATDQGKKVVTDSVITAGEKAQQEIDVGKAETPGLEESHYIERIPARPETAPLYDGLRVPTQFPVIVGCITYKEFDQTETCNCFTQQATKVEVPDKECRSMVASRRFQPYQDAVTPAETMARTDDAETDKAKAVELAGAH